MLFDSSKNKCIFQVLKILSKSSTTYSDLFRKTKVSHITLQKVLKELLKNKTISKKENYSISDKGKKLILLLEEIKINFEPSSEIE